MAFASAAQSDFAEARAVLIAASIASTVAAFADTSTAKALEHGDILADGRYNGVFW